MRFKNLNSRGLSGLGFAGMLDFFDRPADDIAERDDPGAASLLIQDWETRDPVVEHDTGRGSQRGVGADGDELSGHDLVRPAVQE